MLPFTCPSCAEVRLVCEATIELPADARSDEIMAQLWRCEGCGACVLGVYEESRRGAEDSFDHRGWVIELSRWLGLLAELAGCPAPRDRRCGCALHQAWGAQKANGRWNGLEIYQSGPWFTLRRR